MLSDFSVKIKESEKRDEQLDQAKELKKSMEHEGDGNTSRNWCARNPLLSLRKGTGRYRNRKTIRRHSDYSTIKIGQNTVKSPGGLRRLVFT